MRLTRYPEFDYKIDQEPMIDEPLLKFVLLVAHHLMTLVGLDHDADMAEDGPILHVDGPIVLAKQKHFSRSWDQSYGCLDPKYPTLLVHCTEILVAPMYLR